MRTFIDRIFRPHAFVCIFLTVFCSFPGPAVAKTSHGNWQWYQPPGMVCGNGSATGFAVNAVAGSKRTVAYLEGGGACNSQDSCFGAKPTAKFMQGYTEEDFDAWIKSSLSSTNLFARNDPNNPFRNDTIIYVPYCTGDLHAGNKVAPYGAHHMGFGNIQKVIDVVHGAFAADESIDLVLTGASAGGCGALYNLYRVQQSFPQARMTMVDDSCPLLPEPYDMHVVNGPDDPWGLQDTLPLGCTGCLEDLNGLYAYYAQTMPHTRMSHIEALQDAVISGYYGVAGTRLAKGLLALQATVEGNPNFKFYLTPAAQHKYLTGTGVPSLGDTVVRNTSIAQFLAEQLSDDPDWASVTP